VIRVQRPKPIHHRQLVDLGSAIRQLQLSGLDNASARLLLSRKRAELEDLMNRARLARQAPNYFHHDRIEEVDKKRLEFQGYLLRLLNFAERES
jgi:hypothetical protein